MNTHGVDKYFLGITLFLLAFGLIIFISASLGLLARETIGFGNVVIKQIIALIIGIILFLFASRLHYRNLKTYSVFIFALSFVATALVFIPGLGVEFGGAKRWLFINPISFQPAEFLKFGFVVYFSAWLSSIKDNVQTFRYGLLPTLLIFGAISILLLSQPNTGILAIILVTGAVMFVVAGGRWKHLFIILAIFLVGFILLAAFRPYIKDRIITFIDPQTVDPLAEGYQIRQSLIAIGSGQLTGKGFGQGVQKFNYLPEPIGDSVFAVLAEEFGFIGGFTIITAFLIFAVIGLKIAARAPDTFARLLTVGLVILISSQSYLSISAMLGVLPLSGVPILFVSHGGSALVFTLIEAGVILNVSRYIG